ncbi:MAG: HEAT repeat domain-containing protein [Candidatus Limnocylindrales bacterium]
MPLFGPPNVARLEAKKDVSGLIGALGYQRDAAVRKAAAEAFCRLRDPRAVRALVVALGDGPVRPTAVEALIATGSVAGEPLVAALGNWDPKVREAAAMALGRIGDARAVEALIGALGDQAGEVRWAAVESLGEIGDHRATEPLIAMLKDGRMHAAAVAALGAIGDARAVEPLIADLDYVFQGWSAASALEAIGEPSVIPLIAVLGSRSTSVRQEASVTLGRIGDPRAFEPLLDALDDDDWDVRRNAATALVALYRAGRISEAQRAAILSKRDLLIAPRTHEFEHSDSAELNNCGMNVHEDATSRHADQGYEIEFP